MNFSIVLLLAFAAFVTAESTTSIWFFGNAYLWNSHIPRYTSGAASVAGINADATTYLISCLSDAPTTDCQVKTPFTMIQGPGTFSFTGVYTAERTGGLQITAYRDFDCTFTASSISASCSFSYSATGSASGIEYATSTSATTSNIPSKSVTSYKLTVTGGIDSLPTSAATTTSNVAAGPLRPLITAAPIGAAAVAVAGLF
ncbi:hypothetical protein N7481_002448 [Penicillium waksmanii]|uniref:uncharacterized protein n=1 Tax=Penicillium waksmanii TaxID=69791 RepID=UPI002547275C|nr:uncharacterized protein N7481_002448 [Penicillium waksmanii]KAJ5995471.1 hypothetical protein N7481_002448 [Penicillium waksmanii]